jgi:hypothetical protein
MVTLHSLIKTFEVEPFITIVLFLLFASVFYFVHGFTLPSFILWHVGRDVSDILSFCGAWGITVHEYHVMR